jgi:exodeoxyribonuclease VII large subunit
MPERRDPFSAELDDEAIELLFGEALAELEGAGSNAALSVAQLASRIDEVLKGEPLLSGVPVRGEISNWKAHGSGHCYFTLKDEDAQVSCALWRTSAARLSFRPSDGDRVVATGRVEFYGRSGKLSFIVDDLRFDGAGAMYEALERTKLKLGAEGLFDESRKRPLPPLPRRIGVITSPTGAVIHDITNVLTRRWPLATLVFIPARVQGFEAIADLQRALSWASAASDLDLVIVARGGGSAEDLMCFNDEELVRAAAAFPVPLVSAIGHETDWTLLDLAADLRAPTPSAAAEMVAPDAQELLAILRGQRLRLRASVEGPIRAARERLAWNKRRPGMRHPREKLADSRRHLQTQRARLQTSVERRVKMERRLLEARRAQLHALDPHRVLERGYALLSLPDGSLLTSASQARTGQVARATLHDGHIQMRVETDDQD